MTSKNRNPGPDGHEGCIAVILEHLKGLSVKGDGWTACCPAHADSNPSLSITLADDGKVLVHCFAGCATEAVVQALGLDMSVLSGSPVDRSANATPRTRGSGRGWERLNDAAAFLARKVNATVETTYEYQGIDLIVQFAIVRLKTPNDKTFRALHLRDGRWHFGDPDRLLPLFHLPRILRSAEVLVVEGEKCVLQAEEFGVVATTSAHGASAAKKTDWNYAAIKTVTIWPDNDEAGRNYAQDVIRILRTINPEVQIRIVSITGLPDGGDIVDWTEIQKERGLTDEEIAAFLQQLIDAAIPVAERDSAYSTNTTGGVGGSGSWPPPRPISKGIEPPPFPIADAFPSTCGNFRDFVLAVAESYQVPVDLPAMLALAVCGLTLSRTLEVLPLPDWREPLAIYVLSLLASGERKSPVFARMIHPVREWQRQRELSMELAVVTAENDIKLVNEKLSRRRAQAARGKVSSDEGESIESLLRRLTQLEQDKPRPPSLIATEITTEAIGDLLAENNERGIIAAAEGDTLDVMLGRYSHGKPNFGLWLSGHAGDAIDIRRKGRTTLRLFRPALTVALAVQPEAIAELMSSKAAAGRGVLARFFFSRPKSVLGYRKLTPDRVPTQLLDWYGGRVHELLDREVPREPHLLGLSAAADALLLEYREWIEKELRPEGHFSDHTAWGAKLAGAIVRIAGVLHGAADPRLLRSEIDADTMRAALAWGPYLEAHERHVAWLAGDDSTTAIAERVLSWMRRRQLREFSHNDAYNGVRGSLVSEAKDIDAALVVLGELGWIRPIAVSAQVGAGRPASRRFKVHPDAWTSTSQPAPHNTHNTHNPAEGGEAQ